MAERCEWSNGAKGRVCTTHGGTYVPADRHDRELLCSKNPDPFLAAERHATAAQMRQWEALKAELSAFPGWELARVSEDGWEAHGPTGRVLLSPTPHGLVERVRAASAKATSGKAQGVLL
jgi:hypothetical protein